MTIAPQPTCDYCGLPIDNVGVGEIVCERDEGEFSVFDTDTCLDLHIRDVHPDRPLSDRPDLRPLGRKR